LYYDVETDLQTFTLTNFKHSVDVLYRGSVHLEVKEGENIILHAYLPDEKNRQKIIAYSYVTNHSMEVENWEGSTNKLRNNNIVLD
jgi:hypothetical protein